MSKKILFMSVALVLLLSGCLEKDLPSPGPTEAEKQADIDKTIDEFQKDGVLSDEESADLKEIADDYDSDMQEAEYDLVRHLEDKEDEKKAGTGAKGSCNAIAEGSTCLEYYGSMWTEEQMRLNCSDTGDFSLNPCPEGSAGGCDFGAGMVNDMVTWFYLTGGGEITAASLKNAEGACNAGVMSKWITTK